MDSGHIEALSDGVDSYDVDPVDNSIVLDSNIATATSQHQDNGQDVPPSCEDHDGSNTSEQLDTTADGNN